MADGSWAGVLVGVGGFSVGSGEVGDGWGVADGSWTGVLVDVGGSSVGSGEVGDGCGVTVRVGVKVAVGTVWRQASWLGAAQTPAPKNSKPIVNSPIATMERGKGKGESIFHLPSSIFHSPSSIFHLPFSSTLMENEFYTPVGSKAQLILKDVPLHHARFWLSSQ